MGPVGPEGGHLSFQSHSARVRDHLQRRGLCLEQGKAVTCSSSGKWAWWRQLGSSAGPGPIRVEVLAWGPNQQHPHNLAWTLVENADIDLDLELWLWDPKQGASYKAALTLQES